MTRLLVAGAMVRAASLAQAGPVDDARLDCIAAKYKEAISVLRPAASRISASN